MLGLIRSKTVLCIAVTLAVCIAAFLIYSLIPRPSHPSTVETVVAPPAAPQEPETQPAEPYTGEVTNVANTFAIKTPDGWSASISDSSSFLAIMFAQPNQLQSLVYSTGVAPSIDQSGIPAWSGLTEHFFVLEPMAIQQFNPTDHLEVTSEQFVFDDGTVGQKYYVVKHAEEAQKWGGLQKDTEWQGRTYIYEKDGRRIEAHLALYPSSTTGLKLYEEVVRSIIIK
jgi:hypothetical protein